MIFEKKKNWTLGKLFEIVLGPQLQNCTLLCCFLTWCRESEDLDYYPKKETKIFFRFIKSKEKVPKKSFVFLWPGQNQFALFWGPQKSLQFFNFKFSIWRLFFEAIRRYLQNFNYLWQAAKLVDFSEFNLLKYCISDRQHCARFRKSHKSTKSLHPNVQCSWQCTFLLNICEIFQIFSLKNNHLS